MSLQEGKTSIQNIDHILQNCSHHGSLMDTAPAYGISPKECPLHITATKASNHLNYLWKVQD
jgi:hypothetical protein